MAFWVRQTQGWDKEVGKGIDEVKEKEKIKFPEKRQLTLDDSFTTTFLFRREHTSMSIDREIAKAIGVIGFIGVMIWVISSLPCLLKPNDTCIGSVITGAVENSVPAIVSVAEPASLSSTAAIIIALVIAAIVIFLPKTWKALID
ncbi:MAG: hypothetical protein V1887_02790 [Candidatus Aenigmatarchaeota archaeon]